MASGGWAGSTRRQTLPPDWASIRQRILRRDPLCMLCRGRPSKVCDHIGDRNDHSDRNLRGICGTCDTRRSSSQGGKGYAARMAKRFRDPEPHPGMC